MDKLIELIQLRINVLNEEMYDLSELMEDEVAKARILRAAEVDPDSINEAEFRTLFSKDLSSNIDEILSYKGWFTKSSNESQIISVKAKLKELIDSKMKEYNDKYISIRETKIVPRDRQVAKYKEVIDILSNYDNKKISSEEEFNKIDEVISIIGASDEAVDLYLKIAINNIANSRQRNETVQSEPVELTRDLAQEFDEAMEDINTTEEVVQNTKTEREIIIERLNKFLNIERREKPSYVDVKKLIGPMLYSITKKIIMEIKGVIDKTNNDEEGSYIVDFKIIKDYIELYGLDISLEKDYFDATILAELLDAYETQNVEKIKTVTKAYKERIKEDAERLQAQLLEEENAARAREEQLEKERKFQEDFAQALEEEENPEKSLDNYNPLPGLEKYAKLLKDVNEKYKIRDFINNNKNHLSSLTELSNDEIKATFTLEEDFYKYCISTCYAKMLNLLLERKNSEEVVENLEDLKSKLLAAIANYDNYINSMRTSLDDLRESGVPFNYIVIFDQARFKEVYDDEFKFTPLTPEKYSKEVVRCFTELINETNLTEAKPKFHNINRDGKANPAKICDYPCQSSHKMRLTLKIFENPHVVADAEGDKHNVIIIFHNVYARREKSDELMEALTDFDTNQARFEELQRIFGPNGTKEEQEREFARAFSLVDTLNEKAKTKKGSQL